MHDKQISTLQMLVVTLKRILHIQKTCDFAFNIFTINHAFEETSTQYCFAFMTSEQYIVNIVQHGLEGGLEGVK